MWVFENVLIVLLFMGAIGLWTRWVLPVALVGYLMMGGILRGYSWFYHTGLIPMWAMLVLCFTPCGHGWSVDRLLRIWRGQPVQPADREAPIYGWARFAVWTAVAIPYLAAGLSKLRLGGFMWWEADNMKRFMLTDNLAPMQWNWDGALALLNGPEFIFAALGLVGLLAELLFVSVLFSKTARRILPLGLIGLHSGIFFVQNILFFDLILMQAVFFDFRAIRKKLGARFAATHGRLIVLYDGHCSRSQRARLLLTSFDLFERIEFVEVHEADPATLRRDRVLRLERRDLDLWRALTGALPVLWPLVPLLHLLPGVETVIARVDQAWSRNRAEVRVATRPVPVGPVAVRRCVTRGAMLVLAVTLMMGGAWVGNIKWYPFSPFRMYANKSPTELLVYAKAWAHYEDGRVEQACFDRWIGATADARYRQVLRMAFVDLDGRQLCRDFLDACAKQANGRLSDGQRIERFEIQLWRWAYKSEPHSETYGDVAAAFTHAVDLGSPDGVMAAAPPRLPVDNVLR